MSSKKTRIVLSNAQMEALADPLRSELVLSLRAYGRGSAAQLGYRIAVDPKSLYYPLKKLTVAGLVRQVGMQAGKRRAEAVFALTASRFEISPEAPLALRAKLVRTTLRTAEREFLAAQAAREESPEIGDVLRISRCHLWLRPEDRDAFLDRLQRLEEEFGERSKVGRGDLLRWTSLMTPGSTSKQ